MKQDFLVCDVINEIEKQFEEFNPSVRVVPNDSRLNYI